MNTVVYAGRLVGEMKPNKNNPQKQHFEGMLGDLPLHLYGRAGEAAAELLDQPVVATGIIDSRSSDKGNHFVSPFFFNITSGASSVDANLVAFTGTISGVRRIKDGLYSAEVEIPMKEWDAEKNKRVDSTKVIPVTTSNVTDSDIGKNVSVVGRLEVRQGKFIDITPDAFNIEGLSIEDDDDSGLDGLL